MATSLLSALVLNVVASGQLAAGTATVPGGLDEAILHLELWGFASTIVFAIARHTWPNLLLLQPTRRAFITPSLLFWAIGSLGVPLAWLLVPDLRMPRVLATSSQLVGTSMYLVALRLFEPPARRAAIPLVTDPPRVWLRVAFAFLLDSAAADAARSLFQRMELAAGEARAHTDHHR
jgi:hypothetical protein